MKSQHTVKVIGTKSHEALWAEIASQHKEQTPPTGSITVADFSKTYGLTPRQAEHALRSRAMTGELESGIFNRMVGGRLRAISYFWRAGE